MKSYVTVWTCVAVFPVLLAVNQEHMAGSNSQNFAVSMGCFGSSLPSLVLPCRSLSASSVYPRIFGCLGCQPVRNPLICTSLALSYLPVQAAGMHRAVSKVAELLRWGLCSTNTARRAAAITSKEKWSHCCYLSFARGRGSFCNNVTYIPLAIMGRSHHEIAAVEFTDTAEFSPSHRYSFKKQ